MTVTPPARPCALVLSSLKIFVTMVLFTASVIGCSNSTISFVLSVFASVFFTTAKPACTTVWLSRFVSVPLIVIAAFGPASAIAMTDGTILVTTSGVAVAIARAIARYCLLFIKISLASLFYFLFHFLFG